MDTETTEPATAFAALLREYRLGAGLTQESLAERAGVSARNVQNLERGANRPLVDTARRLAAALGLDEPARERLLATVTPAPRRRVTSLVERGLAPPGQPGVAPHNLPAALSSFIGRDAEQARVAALVKEARLVTLTGTGGVGKTRLALAVAEGLLASYPDGVWLVELAALADPALVPGAVAAALGLREEPGRPLMQTLVAHLHARQLLLVLDNCEHVVAACAALVSAVLRAGPAVHILATSREALGVIGERRHRVPSLSVPDPRRLPAPALAQSYEAVRLFVERAQERRADFALSAATSHAIAEVCARLDGVPLAIELAAARAGSLPVEAIAARLDDRFRLLTGGGRDAPQRQQTLRAALDWSWELLEVAERTLLARLSVFAGGCTLAAAETICTEQGSETWAVLDGLDALVGKSLVQVDVGDTDEGRYRLLETVRQYAAERLAETGTAAAVRDRQLAWSLALAEQARQALRGPEQGIWLGRLETEHDNLRAALAWARDSGAADEGLRLAGRLARFWELHNYYGEGRNWLEALLATGEHGTPTARAQALYASSLLAYRQGDYAQAWALGEASLALCRALADRSGSASALDNLGLVAQQQGSYAQARALHEESLALWRELGDRSNSASALDNLGNVAGMQGDLATARILHAEALALQRELGDRWGIALALGNLGVDAERQGDLAIARALHEESLALRRELGDRWGIALALGNLGDVAQQQGDLATARALQEESLSLRRELGDRWGLALALEHLGVVVATQGDTAQARVLQEESLALRRELGDKHGVVDSLDALAELTVACGEPRRGVRLWRAADALRQAHGLPRVPRKQVEHEQALAALGDSLGEEAYTAAVREGRALTLEEAVALALGAPSPPDR